MKFKTILITPDWHGKMKRCAKAVRMRIPDVIHCILLEITGGKKTIREEGQIKEIKQAFAELDKQKKGK